MVTGRRFLVAAVMLGSSCGLVLGLGGCTRSSASASDTRVIAAAQQKAIEQAREQMDMIPPPLKSRYMAVGSLDDWANPYLTVQGAMVTLHVLLADANTTDLGVGGMLRPEGARRENLSVRVSELPTALNAIPAGSWPYGRVVAVEEAHQVPAGAQPEVRRNVEAVMKTLNDLGVVAYEWGEGGK